MAKLNVDPETVLNPGKSTLLPVEEEIEVNGVMKVVQKVYIAEITGAREHTSKAGGLALKLTFAIDLSGGERVYIDDYLSYSPKAAFKIAKAVALLELDATKLDSDDFEGQFLKVTIQHSSYETNDGVTVWNNAIKDYIEPVLPSELPGAEGKKAPF